MCKLYVNLLNIPYTCNLLAYILQQMNNTNKKNGKKFFLKNYWGYKTPTENHVYMRSFFFIFAIINDDTAKNILMAAV